MTKRVHANADLSRSHPPTHEKLTNPPLKQREQEGKEKPPLGGSIAEALRHNREGANMRFVCRYPWAVAPQQSRLRFTTEQR